MNLTLEFSKKLLYYRENVVATCFCSDTHALHARRIHIYYLVREGTLSTMLIYITNSNVKFYLKTNTKLLKK